MNAKGVFISFYTIIRREMVRLFRIWPQTILPSAITITLYYVIFGTFIGSQVGDINGFSYMQFIVPGLIMMTVITNAFTNVVSSFFSAKFMKNLDELIVSPTPGWVMISGFIFGGVLRALIVGAIVLGISLFFTQLTLYNIWIVILFITLTSILFSLGGLLNGMFAKNFDGISIIPTFVLTPLTYLGGVFYSISNLPEFWQTISKANPILYMVNGFRFGFLGISDVALLPSLLILLGFIAVTLFATILLFNRGYGFKN